MKNVYIWIILILVLAGVVWGLVWLADFDSSKITLAKNIGDSDWTLGDKNAKITLVEYSDYQCPACAYFNPLVKKLLEKNPDKIYFAYRHFPLSQHANARPAAYAAEAAGRQGKFWEMHDKIFERQAEWATKSRAEEIFTGYAKELKLDLNKFKIDFNSADTRQTVADDYQSGIDSGVNATPAFFLNGRPIQPQSYDEFQKIIDGAAGH